MKVITKLCGDLSLGPTNAAASGEADFDNVMAGSSNIQPAWTAFIARTLSTDFASHFEKLYAGSRSGLSGMSTAATTG